MELFLLPPPDDSERLLDGLARLVGARRPAPLVIRRIIETAKQYFTDRWTRTPWGAEILARLLLGHAGMNHLEALVDAEAQLGTCANSTRPDRHKVLQHCSIRLDEKRKRR